MQTKEIISSIQSYVHDAQNSSSFIFLREHSRVFKIIYTNFPGNVCSGNVRESDCPGKVLSGKRLVRERPCPGNVLSGKRPDLETSVRASDCAGNVRYSASLCQIS